MTKPSVDEINAVAKLHHAWITGLVLGTITHESPDIAEKLVFQLFRRQHEKRFLPGLGKLGLTGLPDAVACAKYHYFSNQLGGVKVEYWRENDKKAWVRYPPPRWIWYGPAICAIPSKVNTAMLRGWHAQNGVTLNNPNLGFVCTGTTVDGYPGLEGYYCEFEHPLADHERLQYRFEESCPAIDAASLPALDAQQWPAERQALAYRNYAIEYISNALPILVELLGDDAARSTGTRIARLIGMQHYDELAQSMQLSGNSATAFMEIAHRFMWACGDEVDTHGTTLNRLSWRAFDSVDSTTIEIWRAMLEGLLLVHNPKLTITWGRAGERTADCFSVV